MQFGEKRERWTRWTSLRSNLRGSEIKISHVMWRFCLLQPGQDVALGISEGAIGQSAPSWSLPFQLLTTDLNVLFRLWIIECLYVSCPVWTLVMGTSFEYNPLAARESIVHARKFLVQVLSFRTSNRIRYLTASARNHTHHFVNLWEKLG